jgi:hypothetical protein
MGQPDLPGMGQRERHSPSTTLLAPQPHPADVTRARKREMEAQSRDAVLATPWQVHCSSGRRAQSTLCPATRPAPRKENLLKLKDSSRLVLAGLSMGQRSENHLRRTRNRRNRQARGRGTATATARALGPTRNGQGTGQGDGACSFLAPITRPTGATPQADRTKPLRGAVAGLPGVGASRSAYPGLPAPCRRPGPAAHPGRAEALAGVLRAQAAQPTSWG